MSSYLLLRNHQELGPYTIEELETLPLRKEDLVWVSGRSSSWEHPSNIPELRRLVQHDVLTGNEANLTERDFANASFSLSLDHASGQETDAFYKSSRTESIASYNNDPFAPPARESFISRFAWVFVSIAIFLAAFLATRMVADADKSVASKKVVASAPKEILDNTENFQNALTKEFVFVPDSSKIPAKKPKPKNIRKLVQVTNNDYRVGILGGINDLELTIENNSDQIVDKITIQVDYLKPNGDVISSETVSASNIKPNAAKKVNVPSSSRGVKISHKVLDIKAHEFRPAMSET